MRLGDVEAWSDRLSVITGIEPEMLERMGRIARDLPGHTVSLDAEKRCAMPRNPVLLESEPVLKIDGVEAAEILDSCFDQLD